MNPTAANLQSVMQRAEAAAAGREVRLIAVSKLKPAEDIRTLAKLGQRAFAGAYQPRQIFLANAFVGSRRASCARPTPRNACAACARSTCSRTRRTSRPSRCLNWSTIQSVRP